MVYLSSPLGRQFETILSLNKTRDETEKALFRALWFGALFFRGGSVCVREERKLDIKNLNRTQKLTMSALVIAIYVVVMYFTQSFAFLQYQVRIATAIYAVAYLFPFLVIPLGISNLLSNMIMGGLGFFDIVGGGLVGIATAGCCVLLGKLNAPSWTTAIPVFLIPALGVSLWLSGILGIPYWTLAASLLVGQGIAVIAGALLVQALKRIWK